MTDAFTPPQSPPKPPHRAAGDEQFREVAVQVRGQGGVTAQATLRIASLTDRARFARATKTSALLFGLAVVSLPIPPVHWLLVPGFLIAAIVAFFVRIRTDALLDGAVTCPKCRATFEVESQPPTWPLDLTCHQCKAQLNVAPLP